MSGKRCGQDQISGITRRAALGLGSAAGLLLSAPYVRRAHAAETLYINTWGGIWQQAAAKHLFTPFTKATGVRIRTISPVSVAKLAMQVRSGAYEFDATTLGNGDIVRANQAGLLEPITDQVRAQLGTLWPGAEFQNGIASHAFSTVIAYRKDHYPAGGPQSWAEFWDTRRFPGARSLQRYATRILPIALAGDGVPLDKLYPIDVDRAFKSLDKLKQSIRVWWTAGPQSEDLLRDAEVKAIGIWDNRVGQLVDERQPVELVWNQQEIDRSYWVVAKGTPRAALAWEFIKTAVSPKNLAGFCVEAREGPINPKAFAYITPDEAKRMPTYPQHQKLAFDLNVLRFGVNLDTVTRRFDQWLIE